MEKQEFLALIDKYLAGTATAVEMQMLLNYYQSFQDSDAWDQVPEGSKKEALDRVLRKIEAKTVARPVYRLLRYAAAAVFIAVMITAGWLVVRDHTALKQNVAAKTDVKAPAINRASIQLGNGQTVYLDSAGNGQLASLGTVELVKLGDGKIAYSIAQGSTSGEITYHTISNPRGSRVIDMELTDGSHVWLNAGSSMTYPVPMVGKTRDVTIQGEAYFEIAKDASRPFTVSNGGTRVTVLGTHFNVNAYEDEKDVKVTLLEGSVKVENGKASDLLKPGQQAVVANVISVNGDADLEEVMAWKNGFFQFNGMDIQGVMRQLEKWYDVTVRYEGKIKEREFAGQIDRNANLSDVLKILKESNVHFEVNGNQITVKP